MRAGHDTTEAWYLGLMRSHRRGLVSHWPVTVAVLAAALAIAIVVGLLSPDRSRADLAAPPPPAAAASASASGAPLSAPSARARPTTARHDE